MRSSKLLRTGLALAIILRSSIASAGLFAPDNLQECLIDRLSGAKNDTVAHELAAECLQRFGENGRIEKRTGTLAKYHSGRDCTVRKAKDTPSDFAAQVIEANCYLLYEPVRKNRKTVASSLPCMRGNDEPTNRFFREHTTNPRDEWDTRTSKI
ncbi:hypothetical protein [Trinickia dinghuensis]|uniref:Uncharacterized protein n=1 Tax=Trinickia dinghuensis TaxID=2291023 RepID=A0A3D8JRS3_9BURK|nr:hypothetical protein [Trinickia dinghuensis]RDU95254.1 hypothetical protein DWV00_30180 [Trinickia dinghuensis]